MSPRLNLKNVFISSSARKKESYCLVGVICFIGDNNARHGHYMTTLLGDNDEAIEYNDDLLRRHSRDTSPNSYCPLDLQSSPKDLSNDAFKRDFRLQVTISPFSNPFLDFPCHSSIPRSIPWFPVPCKWIMMRPLLDAKRFVYFSRWLSSRTHNCVQLCREIFEWRTSGMLTVRQVDALPMSRMKFMLWNSQKEPFHKL